MKWIYFRCILRGQQARRWEPGKKAQPRSGISLNDCGLPQLPYLKYRTLRPFFIGHGDERHNHPHVFSTVETMEVFCTNMGSWSHGDPWHESDLCTKHGGCFRQGKENETTFSLI